MLRSAFHKLAFCSVLSTAYSFANAALNVSPEAIDVGVLASGSSRTLHLTLSNTGSAPLKLLSAEPECTGCTKVDFKPMTLERGKTFDLPVTFKPPPDDHGHIVRSVTIKTDDPKQPSVKIPLNAYVTETAGVWPAVLIFENTPLPGSDKELSIDLVNVSDKPLTPLYATGPLDGPKLTVPHTAIPPGGHAKLTASWHLPAKPGPVSGQLVLYVDHPALTHLSIPFSTVVAVAVPATGPAAAIPPATRAANAPAVMTQPDPSQITQKKRTTDIANADNAVAVEGRTATVEMEH